MYEPVKDNQEVVALDVPSVMEAALDARNALADKVKEIPTWKLGDSFDQKRAAVEEQMATFDIKFQLLLDNVHCLRGVKVDQGEAQGKIKRAERHRVDKVKRELTASSTPVVLAKAVAAAIVSRVDRFEFSVSACYRMEYESGKRSTHPGRSLSQTTPSCIPLVALAMQP